MGDAGGGSAELTGLGCTRIIRAGLEAADMAADLGLPPPSSTLG